MSQAQDATTSPGAIGQQGFATLEEREVLRRMGEATAIARLRMPRSTLARIAGGFRVREGTLALFRERLAPLASSQVKERPRA